MAEINIEDIGGPLPEHVVDMAPIWLSTAGLILIFVGCYTFIRR